MLGNDIIAGGAPELIGNSFTLGIPAGAGNFGPAAGGGGTYPLFSATSAPFFMTAASLGGGARAFTGFYALSNGF
jgi:hypothetical protein